MAKPTKRKIEPVSDKVQREGKPREAVKRVPLSGDAEPGTTPDPLADEFLDDDLDTADGADTDTADSGGTPAWKSAKAGGEGSASGTKARKSAKDEAAAEKAAGKRRSRRASKRVTEKGTTPHASTRYTPPAPHFEDMPSPLWVPILMFTMFVLGMLTIFLNYVNLVPGGTSNWYLLLGLGFILGGIITATQYR